MFASVCDPYLIKALYHDVFMCVLSQSLGLEFKTTQSTFKSILRFRAAEFSVQEVLDNNLRAECNHDFFALR